MRLLVTCLLLFIASQSAAAYVGPGAGLGAILLTLALIAGVLMLVVGFFWYPLKRMLKSKDTADTTDDND